MDKTDLCKNCGTRKATIKWVGNGSMMDFSHGMYERWCEWCATQAQLFHAETELGRLPEHIKYLKAKIKQLSTSKVKE